MRVTAAEAATLAERASAARLTVPSYMRERSLGRPLAVRTELRLGAAERRELNRIGVNLNQIARLMNAGASAPGGTLEAVERVAELIGALSAGEVV